MFFWRLTSIVVTIPAFCLAETSSVQFSDSCEIVFLNEVDAATRLSTSDMFSKSTAPLERRFRLQSDQGISEQQLLEFSGEQALPWKDSQVKVFRTLFDDLRKQSSDLELPLPPRIELIKTTGKEEGGAAYCRGNSVIFSSQVLRSNPERLKRLVAHELFHILSRNNPQLRDQLYSIIGFKRCGELKLPDTLQKRRLTNPDAPIHEHYIRIEHNGRTEAAVPITLLSTDKFKPGNLFQFLQFRLILIEDPRNGEVVQIQQADQAPVLLDASNVASYAKQIGSNTNYIIHPEEILADNFVALLTGNDDLPDLWIIGKMRERLRPRKGTADKDE